MPQERSQRRVQLLLVLLGVVLTTWGLQIAQPQGICMPHQPNYQASLAKQLAMNKQTWQRLLAHGLQTDSEVRLDFAYHAPNQEKALALKRLLNQETDYEVGVTCTGGWLRKQWGVTGSTQKTKISLAILDQWVEWMATAGQEYGCLFDGWGTSL